MTYDVVNVTTAGEWHAYHAIRRHVLRDARGRSDHDENRSDEHCAATRLDDLGDRRGVVRLVAIVADLQRKGHGRVLSAGVERYALRLDLNMLLVDADPAAVGFYRKTGWYCCMWDETEFVGIAADCVQMVKTPGLRA